MVWWYKNNSTQQNLFHTIQTKYIDRKLKIYIVNIQSCLWSMKMIVKVLHFITHSCYIRTFKFVTHFVIIYSYLFWKIKGKNERRRKFLLVPILHSTSHTTYYYHFIRHVICDDALNVYIVTFTTDWHVLYEIS